MTITLPLPEYPGANQRVHWTKRRRIAANEHLYAKSLVRAVMAERGAPFPTDCRRIRLRVTWYLRERCRAMDDDNAYSRLKAFR